jgi:hypothetical protein
MAIDNNALVQVQTYNRSDLALLQNLYCFIGTSNGKFKNFQNEIANLGSSTTMDLPPRFTSADGLVASYQPAVQRTATITCDQATNTSYGFTAQERIFNVDKDVDSYMSVFGKSAAATLGSKIEANIAKNANSSVPVYNVVNGQQVATGALHTESGPTRFFGDGVTQINSYQQLDQMIENFLATGMASDIKVYLPNTKVPSIIGNGLNQFAPNRNNEIANSWEIGEFAGVRYYKSNLLPTHTAGTLGQAGTTLTVTSTNDPTGANITQITCSGAGTDADAIKSADLGQFLDPSAALTVRQLTFIGNNLTDQPVQFRVTANAASSGGNVTFNITPALQATAGANQNISKNIVAGMTLKFLPSHKCGVVIAGGANFISMPRLPDQSPFATANEADPDSGLSIRMTTGALLGQNFTGTIKDCTWGSLWVPEYTMRMAFPL